MPRILRQALCEDIRENPKNQSQYIEIQRLHEADSTKECLPALPIPPIKTAHPKGESMEGKNMIKRKEREKERKAMPTLTNDLVESVFNKRKSLISHISLRANLKPPVAASNSRYVLHWRDDSLKRRVHLSPGVNRYRSFLTANPPPLYPSHRIHRQEPL